MDLVIGRVSQNFCGASLEQIQTTSKTNSQDTSRFNSQIQPPKGFPGASPHLGQPKTPPSSPRPHLSSGRRALLPLVQGKRVLWCLGGWSSRLPFLPPLSLHLRPLLHVPGPHGAEIHSLILRLKIRDAQIPCVLSQVFGAREARGDLGALVLVRVGEISQQEPWGVAGPLLVPVDAVNTDIMVTAQRAGQADRGSKGRGHRWRLIQHRLRATSWGHRSMWASRAKQGKGRGQGP